MATGYRLPGTRLEEVTQPQTPNLTSSFRLLVVMAEFNPKIRVTAEDVVKSDPLLGNNYYASHADLIGKEITAVATLDNKIFFVGTALTGLFVTFDGGATFTQHLPSTVPVTLPNQVNNTNLPDTRITSVFFASGKLYVGTVKGLAVSNDNGLTFFRNYSDASISFETPVIPLENFLDDEITAIYIVGANWYIGTPQGLHVSNDSGLTFEIFRSGAGRPEEALITADDDTSITLQDKHWLLSSETTDYYIWYSVNGAGVDPGPIGPRTAIKVDLPEASTASEVITATSNALDAIGAWTVIPSGTEISLTNIVKAVVTNDIADGVSGGVAWGGPSFSVTQQGVTGVKEKTTFTAPAEAGLSLQSKHFNMETPSAVQYYVWYNINGGGSDPKTTINHTLFGTLRTGIEVAITQQNENINNIAAATKSAIEATTTDFTVAVDTGTGITITNVSTGDTVDAVDGTGVEGTTFNFTAKTDGDPGTSGTADFELSYTDIFTDVHGLVTSNYTVKFTYFNGVASVDLEVTVPIVENGFFQDILNAITTDIGFSASDLTISNTGTDFRVTNALLGSSSTVVISAGSSNDLLAPLSSVPTNIDGTAATPEIQAIEMVVETITLGGKYITVNAPISISTGYYIWLNVDGGSNDPLVAVRTAIEVGILATDANTVVATKIKDAVDLITDFVATNPVTTDVAIESAITGDTANASNGTLGVTLIIIEGITELAEISIVQPQGETPGLGGKFFNIYTPLTGQWAIWYNVDLTNNQPLVNADDFVEVQINSADTAAVIATKTQAAMDLITEFDTVTVIGTKQVEVVNRDNGAVNDVHDATINNLAWLFTTQLQGFNDGVLSGTEIKSLYVLENDVYVGTANAGVGAGIDYSFNGGGTWETPIALINVHPDAPAAAIQPWVTDISVTSTHIFVSSGGGISKAKLSDFVFVPSPDISDEIEKLFVTGIYTYGSSDSGLYVSSDSGETYTKRTIANTGNPVGSTNNLKENDINFIHANGQVLYIGTLSGIQISRNTDTVFKTTTGGVEVLKIGSTIGLSNFKTGINYNFTTAGEVIWLNESTAVPAIGASYFVTYDYNRPDNEFNKLYTFESFDDFREDWGMPKPEHIGNVFIWNTMITIGLEEVAILPLKPGAPDNEYVVALDTIKERNVQDIIVLNTSASVQTTAAFDVQERSAPENAFYRMYWTGADSSLSLGDVDEPNSIIGQKLLFQNERVIFVNANKATATFLLEDGTQESVVVDGAFISGSIVAFYNAQPNQNPNVESIGKIIPGINLLVSDFDELYSRSKLEKAGASSLFLLEPVGAQGFAKVVDDLTTDGSDVLRQNPNVVRTKDFVNNDLAFQIDTVFRGELMVDPGSHITALTKFLRNLFAQYKSNQIIANFANISAQLSKFRPDTVEIRYAIQPIFTHKYTEGTFFLSLPASG